jgi:methylthioribulose-1-phosphate dehydratase
VTTPLSHPASDSHPSLAQPDFSDSAWGLIHIGREFHARGWSLGTSSNYSIVVQRDPLQLLVTASGLHKEQLKPDDFARIDDQGRPVDSLQPKSSAETMLHVAIAEQSQVGAVLHTHSVWCTILSDLDFEQGAVHLRGYEMLKGLAGVTTHEADVALEIFDNTQDIPQLAQRVRQRLHDPVKPLRHAFLIRRHGLYTWGRHLAEARRHVEVVEFLLECEGRRRTLIASHGASPR